MTTGADRQPIAASRASSASTHGSGLAQEIAHRLGHLLPAQAPIRDFVHHNTLHGWQHLPFAEALREVHALSGVWPWLPEDECRQLKAAGRIDDADLRHALARMAARAEDWPKLPAGIDAERFFLQLLAGEHPVVALSPAALRWAQEGVPVGLQALWDECVAVLPAPAADLQNIEAAAAATADALFSQLGRRGTWREVVLALTGEDPLPRVQASLIRFISPHLDQSVAAWSHPRRRDGLYAAWRDSLSHDATALGDDGRGMASFVARLPSDPLATIEQLLAGYGLAEADFADYLVRLGLQLPGWAGMIFWRQQHPRYADAPSPEEAPVGLIDYLAILLASEFRAVTRLVEMQFSLRPRIDLLRWYFKDHPAELVIRQRRFAGRLGEALADRAQQLMLGGPNRPEEDAPAWRTLAANILAAEAADRVEAHAGEVTWPLFLIARNLGLDVDALRALGFDAGRLIDAWRTFDGHRRGETWLLAYEHHYRARYLNALAALREFNALTPGANTNAGRPQAQLVFCMDEREEGIRRHLEEVAPQVETFGAAGFFGVAMYWQGLGASAMSAQCPVVVTPAHRVCEVPAPGQAAVAERAAAAHARRADFRHWLWQGGRIGALTPLATSLAAGPLSIAALLGKTIAPAWWNGMLQRLLRRGEPIVATRVDFTAGTPVDRTPLPTTGPTLHEGFTDDEQAARVEGLLRTIGLVDDFAPVVVVLGHGSSSLNNPHASAYDCGACSGRHGGPNARVLAAMANRPAVRKRLAERGVLIPDSSWFVGAERNTCDEHVEWYDLDLLPEAHAEALGRLRGELRQAGRLHAQERCRRFASAPLGISPEQAQAHVKARAADFAQARPELGHCTNAAAIIGRRRLSRGLFLDRRSFLISYDPMLDDEGKTLESILLAAGPVGAGISLEYYFSTVNNERFGCSSKVTHNLAGNLGVMEGAASDLRTGLPRQMIEIHEAMRLLVVCEAEPATLSAILARQPGLAELFGNAWVQLVAVSPADGGIAVFEAPASWRAWQAPRHSLPKVARSAAWFAGQREALPPALLTGEPA
jgi:uncharacterized protein